MAKNLMPLRLREITYKGSFFPKFLQGPDVDAFLVLLQVCEGFTRILLGEGVFHQDILDTSTNFPLSLTFCSQVFTSRIHC